MKKLLSFATLMLAAFALRAQSSELPDTQVKDIAGGKKIAFNKTFEPGKVTLVSFWATWCVPCKKEIKNIRSKLEGWKKESDFNYITVSVDKPDAEGLVRAYAKSQGWDFAYYMDPNADLQRSLNFQNVPFTMIVDKTGKVAYMHPGYEEGGEDDLFAKVKELSK